MAIGLQVYEIQPNIYNPYKLCNWKITSNIIVLHIMLLIRILDVKIVTAIK